MRKLSLTIVLLTLIPCGLHAAGIDPAGVEFFEKKIRPVLVDHCYKCHSVQANQAGKLKGTLFLDSQAGMLKGGEKGAVIVRGHPERSRMIEAVKYGNKDLQMPPKDRLSETVVVDLEKWIAMGAPDPRAGPVPVVKKGIDLEAGRKWWAFAPLGHFDPPAVKNQTWVKTDIDRFVLKKLEDKGLSPNSIASKQKLIRRAYFDLIGLPPTPAQVDGFVADSSPDAYEKLIDQLLDNPHFGERWARHWLDVARYAESDGFEQDFDRPAAYQFRDFVIRAFNQDMPFDQFLQWQLAGDELAPDDWQAMAATGFLTAGVFPTQITEREFESTRYNQLDDMISTTGTSMLGLTIGCARCHDHKYDPIATEDYYRLIATFGTAIRSDIELDITTPRERERLRREFAPRIGAARAKVDEFARSQLPARFASYVESLKENSAPARGVWTVLNFDQIKTAHGTKLEKQPDGSLLKVGKTPARDTYTLVSNVGDLRVTALRLQALADKSLPHNGPGAADNGNFALCEIVVTAAPADGSAPPARVKIISARATHQQNATNLSVAASFDGNGKTGWAVDGGGIGKSQAAIFQFEKPIAFSSGTVVTVELRFEHPNAKHLIGRPRLSVTSLPDVTDFKAPEGPEPAVAAILAELSAGKEVSAEKTNRLRKWYAATLPEYQRLQHDLSTLEAQADAKQLQKVQVTSEGLPPVKNLADGRGYPHFYKQVYLLRRGDPNNKVEPVSQSFLRVLMRNGEPESHWQTAQPAETRTSNRRSALARWITDTQDGAGELAARVIVNRLWQHHLGRGIVATPNDFGLQGEPPTQPELLDWLAQDLIHNGWKLKRLHKLIMTSSVYMQDSVASQKAEAVDPHDVLLWRWQPRRLEAEPIRDAMLAVAGELDQTLFGPGTLDETMRRRSIYFTIKRSKMIPMMMVLDWPEALNSLASRPTTTVAPQALLFLNSPQAREYAQGLAARAKGSLVAGSIASAYRIALGRSPTEAEIRLACGFIENQTKAHERAGDSKAESSALTDFCQALMSTNEFVYIE
jgi:hypothetical protein